MTIQISQMIRICSTILMFTTQTNNKTKIIYRLETLRTSYLKLRNQDSSCCSSSKVKNQLAL